jgi:hypothetical protein
LLASDYASPLTATVVNVTSGEIGRLGRISPENGVAEGGWRSDYIGRDRNGTGCVDALLSDLGIDTEEASRVRVALRSAAPGISTVITGMRSVRNVDATPPSASGATCVGRRDSRKVWAPRCRGTGLWLRAATWFRLAPGDSTGLRRQALRNERHLA